MRAGSGGRPAHFRARRGDIWRRNLHRAEYTPAGGGGQSGGLSGAEGRDTMNARHDRIGRRQFVARRDDRKIRNRGEPPWSADFRSLLSAWDSASCPATGALLGPRTRSRRKRSTAMLTRPPSKNSLRTRSPARRWSAISRWWDTRPRARISPDRYEIDKAEKVEGHRWLITARIKYGKHDVKLPITLEVYWAGDTPVITRHQRDRAGHGHVRRPGAGLRRPLRRHLATRQIRRPHVGHDRTHARVRTIDRGEAEAVAAILREGRSSR